MSNSPFSEPPIPVFSGAAGKIQMALTIKAAIDAKKDFIDSVKNAAKVKATQAANELKDIALKEARERGQSAANSLKKKREEARARDTSARNADAAKTTALTSTPTASVASAKDIPDAVEENPQLNTLRQQREKLATSIDTLDVEYNELKKQLDASRTAASRGIDTPTYAVLVRKEIALNVQRRELNAKLTDIDVQIEAEIIKITG